MTWLRKAYFRGKKAYMLVYVHGAKCIGIKAVPVTVEVEMSLGVGIHLVGLADAAVKESLLRTVTALQSMGFRIPGKRIIINLPTCTSRGADMTFPLPLGLLRRRAKGSCPFWNNTL